MLATNKTVIRAAAIRCLRYLSISRMSIEDMIRLKVDLLLVKSIEREPKNETERAQALKYVRQCVDCDADLLPRSFVQSIVAVADNPEDPYRDSCLEILCEAALRNPNLVAHSDGIRVLISASLEDALEPISESILITVLFLLNEPSSRQYVRPLLDWEIILAPFTDMLAPDDEERVQRFRAARRAIGTIMKSWTGIICLSSSPVGLRSLVAALKLNDNPMNQKVALYTLCDIFRVYIRDEDEAPRHRTKTEKPAPKASKGQMLLLSQDEIAPGSMPPLSLATALGLFEDSEEAEASSLLPRVMQRHNLLNNYLSVLLLAFMQTGLIPALADCGKHASPHISKLSTRLLGEILHLSDSLLPSHLCTSLHALPSVVGLAANYEIHPLQRLKASALLSSLSNLSRSKRLQKPFQTDASYRISRIVSGTAKWSRMKDKEARMDRMDALRKKVDADMDDAHFAYYMKDSGVLLTKDFTKWKLDIMAELLEGPLMSNSQRLTEALKTKFIKRILSFLKPFKNCFSTLAHEPRNMSWVRIGCVVLEVLMSSPEGVEYLWSSKLIQSIASEMDLEFKHEVSLQEEKEKERERERDDKDSKDKEGGDARKIRSGTFSSSGSATPPHTPRASEGSRYLSEKSLLRTMSREYFTLLGALSSCEAGKALLTRSSVFALLYPLAGLEARPDLSSLIITSLDYNIEGHPRVILATSITSGTPIVRKQATRHLRTLLRAGVANFADWGIDLLVTQLHDPDDSVKTAALSVLEESCDNPEILAALISKRPSLHDVGGKSKDILLRFMSLPSGFDYLGEMEWTIPEMEEWVQVGNEEYVAGIEADLQDALASQTLATSDAWHVGLPPHFFGELVKTDAGCTLLRNAGHVESFVNDMCSTTILPIRRRAAVWALGHIGSSSRGWEFLKHHEVLPQLAKVAADSAVLSFRGTCYYVIGLLSRCPEARVSLQSIGWESPSNLEATIAVPRELHTFLRIPDYDYSGSWAKQSPVDLVHFDRLQLKDIETEFLHAIFMLSNRIKQEQTSKTIRRLRNRHPVVAMNPSVFFGACLALENYRYQAKARKFIFSLFDGVDMNQEYLRGLDSLKRSVEQWQLLHPDDMKRMGSDATNALKEELELM